MTLAAAEDLKKLIRYEWRDGVKYFRGTDIPVDGEGNCYICEKLLMPGDRYKLSDPSAEFSCVLCFHHISSVGKSVSLNNLDFLILF
jgi:hypothetical protein